MNNQEILQAARYEKTQGAHERVASLAGMVAQDGNTQEIHEAKELIAWAAAQESLPHDFQVSAANGHAARLDAAGPIRVTVINFDMEFWSIVSLMVKVAIASIPAILILGLFAAAIFLIVGATLSP